MTSTPGDNDEAFAEASRSWDLQKLYTDLASVKGRGLTRTEKLYLRGLLCSYSPNEIATQLHVSPETVRTALSKGLYRYIEELLIRQERNKFKVKDWSRVANLLEKAGYKIQSFLQDSSPKINPEETDFTYSQKGWNGVPDVSVFHGRSEELATLKQWIINDDCRLVVLWGMGGIGKTTVAAKLTELIQDKFEYVLWRSLRNAPPIQELLTDLLHSLPIQQKVESSTTTNILISRLMEYFRNHRCLLVLEDMQWVLSSGEFAGQYQVGYEGYGELLRHMGEERHQSCLLLTSGEKPREIALLEGPTRPVRSSKLKGLGVAAKAILEDMGLKQLELWEQLSEPYRGNPWALKSIATTIQDLFEGSIAEFLNQNTFFLGDFEYLLYQQFNRLSDLEKEIICWLAADKKTVALSKLQEGIQSNISRSELIKAVQSLERRSLIEKVKTEGDTLFTLQPVVMKYALNQSHCR